MRVAPAGTRTGLVTLLTLTAALLLAAAQSPLPAESLHYGRFRIQFSADGTLVIDGHEWKPFTGHWTVEGNELSVRTSGGVRDCGDTVGRYRFRLDGTSLSLDLIADECGNRRMVLRESAWRPAGSTVPAVERKITHTSLHRARSLPKARPAAGSWPSFRGPQAAGVADGQHLPDRWDPTPARTSSGARRSRGSPTPVRSSGATACSSRRPSAAIRTRCSSREFRSPNRPPIAPVTNGCSTPSTSTAARLRGSAWPSRGRRGTDDTSSRLTRARRPRPTDASWSPGSARRACTRTT